MSIFRVRLKNLLRYYLQSRNGDDFEKNVDVLVSDHLKETLSPSTLNYVLSFCLWRPIVPFRPKKWPQRPIFIWITAVAMEDAVRYQGSRAHVFQPGGMRMFRHQLHFLVLMVMRLLHRKINQRGCVTSANLIDTFMLVVQWGLSVVMMNQLVFTNAWLQSSVLRVLLWPCLMRLNSQSPVAKRKQ